MIDPRQPVPPPAPPPAAAVAHVPTARERQALAEVGHTALGRGVRLWLPLAFLATLAAGLLVDLVPPVRVPVELVQARWPEVRRAAASAGWLAGNRLLVGLLNDFEDALGRDSRVTAAAQPLAQRVLTGELGVGNEQVYLGRDGWLFFRRDLDYVTGPPFLAPRTVHRRSRGGDAWTAAPHPDPLPAIRELHVALRARGITLVLAPTPLKPVVHPERLSSRYAAGAGPLHNASYAAFVERVAAAGVGLVDLSAPLSRAAATGPQFLRTDTHWTPQAMDLAARELAGALAPLLGPAGGPPAGAPPAAPAPSAGEGVGEAHGWPPPPAAAYRRVAVSVEGRGDLTAMLRLTPGNAAPAAERVLTQRVLRADGRAWAPAREAEVLLLGDSFTNVFSVPALGWGSGAGLAEQLAFHLGRPVDRLAVNDDGAHATRERLAAALARGDDRLAGKRVVVWQFALRELSGGDWRPVALPRP